MSWVQVDRSHLMTGPCVGCGEDTLAAPDQTENAWCSACRAKGRNNVQQFSAPSVETFRKKTWKRGADGIIRDHWGRYVLPDPTTGELREYTRVSTLKDVFTNGFNIKMWDRRTSVYGLAISPDLVAQAALAQPDAEGRFAPNSPWREHIDRIAKLAFLAGGGERNADKGTEWHRWRELWDAAQLPENTPDEIVKTLEARQQVMNRYGLTVPAGMSERVVIIPALDAAGTFDEIFEDANGEWFIGDEKSQRDFYDGGLLEAIQLAAYAHAEWIVDVAEVGSDAAANLAALTPMPKVNRDVAKIVWVPQGKAYAEVKNVTLDEPWQWALLALRLRVARKCEWVTTAPLPEVPALVIAHESSELLQHPEIVAAAAIQAYADAALCRGSMAAGHAWNCEKPHAPGVRTIRDILVQRIEGLAGAPDAREQLDAMWRVQDPLGHWDSGLTDLGMTVLQSS